MAQPSLPELSAAMNQVQSAMKNLQTITPGITSNPSIDKNIGKAYKRLNKALQDLTAESTFV